MARKMVINDGNSQQSLTETVASNEQTLQELVKDNPDILPYEEYDLTGPLMVVGRETTLTSGLIDLVGMTRYGEILVIEFKTGPQNSDFRHSLSQLLDYGSDLWGMTYDEFESTVAVRYFKGDRCNSSTTRGKNSLAAAIEAHWAGITADEIALIKDNLSNNLKTGKFHYLLVASRFTKSIENTINYLNSITPIAKFYAVELISFSGNDINAFETRTLLKPETRSSRKTNENINETDLLDAIVDNEFRDTVQELFEVCHAFRLRFEWGAVGASIRLATSDRPEPISIGWINPPGKTGWMGLSGLTLGYDTTSAARVPSVVPFLEQYVLKIGKIEGVMKVSTRNLEAYSVPSKVAIDNFHVISEILAELVSNANAA